MKKVIITILILFPALLVHAQESGNLKIKDLLVIEELVDVVNPNSGLADTSYFNFKVMYKISDVSQAKKLYAEFGTEKGNGSILTIEPEFIKQNTNYFLKYNSVNYAVVNYTSSFKVKIPKSQCTNLKFLTVKLEDINGAFTSKLYFQIKP